ncbi:MAG: ROK family transcriptional regulator [Clostridia bacterium]
MATEYGRNAHDVKIKNRCLVLRTIALRPMISRSEIAKATGLSKMSMTNIIGELMQMGLVSEPSQGREEIGAMGRRPGYLDLAAHAPCVIGVFVGRSRVEVSLADLRARIFRSEIIELSTGVTAEKLLASIVCAIQALERGTDRRILGVGVAAIGPVDIGRGIILRPANFHGLHDIPIVAHLVEATGYPTFLAPDSLAGALAEKLYGTGEAPANFLFLLIWDGIGCGIIVDHKPYTGQHGLAGEMGHTSIAYDGPMCTCGSRGCLELYANVQRMIAQVEAWIASGKATVLSGQALNWSSILSSALKGDAAALAATNQYCDYLACALVNYINVFDPQTIYLCHQDDQATGLFLARCLSERIDGRILAHECRTVAIVRATFGGRATVIGSVALVTGRVFDGTLPFSGNA